MHLKFLRTKFRAHVAPRLRQASNACNETSKTSGELYRVQCAFKISNCSKHERDPFKVITYEGSENPDVGYRPCANVLTVISKMVVIISLSGLHRLTTATAAALQDL